MNAQGSRRYLAYVREKVEGTTPTTPVLTKIRNTGGSGISNERTSIESAEFRSDRGVADMRLGQNQPNLAVPFELSAEAFDAMLEGALADRFNGGFKITATVDFDDTTYSMTHNSSDWVDVGLKIGDYVVISGAVASGNNGAFYVSNIVDDVATLLEVDGTTPATITDATADAIVVHTGAIGGEIDTSGNTITVAATGKTMTAGSSLWLARGIKVGDWINFAGFTNAANNGWHRVTAVTATVLTFGASTLTNETKSTGTVIYGSFVGLVKTNQSGLTPTFTIEEGFDDINQFHNVSGVKIDSMKLSFQPDSMVTGEFAMKAMKYVDFSGTSIGTVQENATKSPFDTYSGTLKVAGDYDEADAIVSGMELNLVNGLSPRYALMSKDSSALGEGRQKVTGSITAYFADANLMSKYSAETEFEIEVCPQDTAGNKYHFTMPRCKFTSAKRDTKEGDVTQSLDFQAFVDSTYGTTLLVRKSPDAV